jgi:hypothetical protein
VHFCWPQQFRSAPRPGSAASILMDEISKSLENLSFEERLFSASIRNRSCERLDLVFKIYCNRSTFLSLNAQIGTYAMVSHNSSSFMGTLWLDDTLSSNGNRKHSFR